MRIEIVPNDNIQVELIIDMGEIKIDTIVPENVVDVEHGYIEVFIKKQNGRHVPVPDNVWHELWLGDIEGSIQEELEKIKKTEERRRHDERI